MAEKVKVDPKDVKIDSFGKVEITNKALAEKLKQLLDENNNDVQDFSADAMMDVNFGC